MMRLSVAVSHGSTFEPNTTFTDEALGAKAAAEAGRSCGGMTEGRVLLFSFFLERRRGRASETRQTRGVK